MAALHRPRQPRGALPKPQPQWRRVGLTRSALPAPRDGPLQTYNVDGTREGALPTPLTVRAFLYCGFAAGAPHMRARRVTPSLRTRRRWRKRRAARRHAPPVCWCSLNSQLSHARTPARVLIRTAHPMQVAIGAVFLAYALRGGQVRVLDLQRGTRVLLRGHEAAVSDLQVRHCFRALQVRQSACWLSRCLCFRRRSSAAQSCCALRPTTASCCCMRSPRCAPQRRRSCVYVSHSSRHTGRACAGRHHRDDAVAAGHAGGMAAALLRCSLVHCADVSLANPRRSVALSCTWRACRARAASPPGKACCVSTSPPLRRSAWAQMSCAATHGCVSSLAVLLYCALRSLLTLATHRCTGVACMHLARLHWRKRDGPCVRA